MYIEFKKINRKEAEELLKKHNIIYIKDKRDKKSGFGLIDDFYGEFSDQLKIFLESAKCKERNVVFYCETKNIAFC